jgi:tol-pal system protein YbgF
MKQHHFKLTSTALACVLAGALAFAPAAQAGLFDDDEAREAILDLRKRIDQNRIAQEQKLAEEAKRSADENAQLRRGVLELNNQIESLKAEMARMRGNDEQLARDVADMQRRQKDLAQGLDQRLQQFEPVKVQADGREFLADPAEKREFEAALATFRKGDFGLAQSQFGDFTRKWPSSGYGGSALFWLGNAQYALRSYNEAINSFRTLTTRYPEHARAPEAMLGLANCQIELKDNRSARASLDALLRTHPQSEAASAGKERLARLPPDTPVAPGAPVRRGG